MYDDLDRLTAVVRKDPATGANLSKSEYVYDGFSRLRISKEFTWNGTDWDEIYANQKNRIYDGMDVIREQNVWGTNVATYVRDGNIGGLLSKENMTGERFYYHYDGSGNVVGMTDEQQNVVAEYTYDAWGTLLSSSGSEAGNNTYRFSTKEYFADTGLYNYGYRFYSPGMGRWINRDPLGEAGGLNLYNFVSNNPVNAVDPRGLQEYDIIPYGPRSTRISGWENHHAVNDVWARNNIPSYSKYSAPSVRMTPADHGLTKREFNLWRHQETGSVTGPVNWAAMSPEEAFNLSERQFDSANVPQWARNRYYSALNSYNYTGTWELPPVDPVADSLGVRSCPSGPRPTGLSRILPALGPLGFILGVIDSIAIGNGDPYEPLRRQMMEMGYMDPPMVAKSPEHQGEKKVTLAMREHILSLDKFAKHRP